MTALTPTSYYNLQRMFCL